MDFLTLDIKDAQGYFSSRNGSSFFFIDHKNQSFFQDSNQTLNLSPCGIKEKQMEFKADIFGIEMLFKLDFEEFL